MQRHIHNWSLKHEDPEVKLGRSIFRIFDFIPSILKWIMNILAVMISWHFNESIFWAIVSWIFSPIYLLYSLLKGRFHNGGLMDIINTYI